MVLLVSSCCTILCQNRRLTSIQIKHKTTYALEFCKVLAQDSGQSMKMGIKIKRNYQRLTQVMAKPRKINPFVLNAYFLQPLKT